MLVRLAAGLLESWCLTHHQVVAALPIVLRTGEGIVGYADVALLAAVLQNDLFATSLRRLYLKPLERERDGGATARQTLRRSVVPSTPQRWRWRPPCSSMT